jgi:hypothetical protein
VPVACNEAAHATLHPNDGYAEQPPGHTGQGVLAVETTSRSPASPCCLWAGSRSVTALNTAMQGSMHRGRGDDPWPTELPAEPRSLPARPRAPCVVWDGRSPLPPSLACNAMKSDNRPPSPLVRDDLIEGGQTRRPQRRKQRTGRRQAGRPHFLPAFFLPPPAFFLPPAAAGGGDAAPDEAMLDIDVPLV